MMISPSHAVHSIPPCLPLFCATQISVQQSAKPLNKALLAANIGQCGTNPVPQEGEAYSLYAAGQRCAQAQPVSVGGRRHLEWGDVDAARHLQVTADTCWAACANEGYSAPFYMNLYNAGGQAQCFWCVSCLTLCGPPRPHKRQLTKPCTYSLTAAKTAT